MTTTLFTAAGTAVDYFHGTPTIGDHLPLFDDGLDGNGAMADGTGNVNKKYNTKINNMTEFSKDTKHRLEYPQQQNTTACSLNNISHQHIKSRGSAYPITNLPPAAVLPPTAPPTPLLETAGCPASFGQPPVILSRPFPRASKKKEEEVVELPVIHSGSFKDVFERSLVNGTGTVKKHGKDGCGTIDEEADSEDEEEEEVEEEQEDAFFVCDLGSVYNQYVRWQANLGSAAFKKSSGARFVEPFYAVKCNPDPYVIRLLASLGAGFDCASQNEISSVLSIGVDPQRVIYANPCKANSFIRHAAREGIEWMTFDNHDELVKVSKFHPGAKMVLRILTDDEGSLCRFGMKFGAPLEEVRGLLKKAVQLGVEVVGVSFHVGSGCSNPGLYRDAIKRARWTFDVGKEEGFDFDLLDIGGGFDDETFEGIAGVVVDAIEESFPASSDEDGKPLRIIAEPGRYFVTGAFQLATNIIARRGVTGAAVDAEKMAVDEGKNGSGQEEEKPVVMYYINDGVYGAFNCIIFDHQVVQPHVLTLDGEFLAQPPPTLAGQGDDVEECKIFGQTCDSIDLVCPLARLPTQLRVGDWLRWERMGAYTICAASQFNGMKLSKVVYTLDMHGKEDEEKRVRKLLEGPFVRRKKGRFVAGR